MKTPLVSFFAAVTVTSLFATTDSAPRTSGGIAVVNESALHGPALATQIIDRQVADNSGEPVGAVRDIDLTGLIKTQPDEAGAATSSGAALLIEVVGIGPDALVRIPVAKARFETRQVVIAMQRDRLLQPGTSDSLVAAADGESASVPAGGQFVTGPRDDAASAEGAVATAEQLQQIQSVLAAAGFSELKVFAASDALLVSGDVADTETRERVLQLVQQHTKHTVRDATTVRAAE